MSRPITLSNGGLHIGINRFGMVHDFYYPYIGLENHATAKQMRHKIGIWIDYEFSWLDDNSWEFRQVYEPGALIGITTARSSRLGITMIFHDCVDSEIDAFLRSIEVFNHSDKPRHFRLFMHQVFMISNSLSGDTAQYLPGEAAILHYKGHRAFVIGAENHRNQTFDQYAIGIFGIEGKEGTFRDAEDGELSGNAVEHGRPDSVIRCTLDIEAHGSARVNYWVTCGRTQKAAIALHRAIVDDSVYHRQAVTEQSWRFWLDRSKEARTLVPKELEQSFTHSLLITKSHIDSRGGVVASTDTAMLNYARDSYAYCWPRDGAYALWPLLRLGYQDELQRFFEFCKRGLSADGFLVHKYQADGAIGSSWHPYIYAGKPEPPIQEDETAIVLFLCGQYYQQTNDEFFLKYYYPSLVKPMANFLANYIDRDTKLPHASYDLWEEKFLTSTYTTAVVCGALNLASQLAEKVGDEPAAIGWQLVAADMRQSAQELLFNKDRKFFYKGVRIAHGSVAYHDDVIDISSFYGAYMFGLFDIKSEEVQVSFETLGRTFDFSINPQQVTPMPRYERDRYNAVDPQNGNPWFITTLWLAQYYLEIGNIEQAQMIVNWVRDHMLPSGVLSEQINPFNFSQYISVAPLTWSQAEYMNTVLDLMSHLDGNAGAR
ncbi:MAG TPA: glycoside hydrolase family 15 protein [Candidatus Saccharimonadales bacterium]